MLDSSRLDELLSLQKNLFGNEKRGVLSAAILIKSIGEFCLVVEKLSKVDIIIHFAALDTLTLEMAKCRIKTLMTPRIPENGLQWFPNNLLRNMARNVPGLEIEWFLLLDVDLGKGAKIYQSK